MVSKYIIWIRRNETNLTYFISVQISLETLSFYGFFVNKYLYTGIYCYQHLGEGSSSVIQKF